MPVSRVDGQQPVSGTRPDGRVAARPCRSSGCGTRIEPPPSVPTPATEASAREQRRLAAARAAAGPRRIVRIGGAAVQRVLGLVRPRVLGHVRLAGDDRARGAQARDHGRVRRGHVTARGPTSRRCWRRPAVAIESLTVSGRPSSGRRSPLRRAASAASAARRAASSSRATRAFRAETASSLASTRSTSSRAERSPASRRRSHSRAEGSGTVTNGAVVPEAGARDARDGESVLVDGLDLRRPALDRPGVRLRHERRRAAR